MRSWRLLSRLLVVAGGFSLPAAAAEARLSQDVVPTFQSIRLKADADTTDYTGSVAIHLDVRKPTARIQLHAEGLRLGRVTLTRKGKAIAVKHASGEDGLLTLTAERELTRGPARLEIEFANAFDTQAVSLYRMVRDGRGYLFSQMEAAHARSAFPCFDEPGFKFPYQLTLEVPERHQALSNTPIERETVRDGWKTVVFRRTPPMPSYLLAIASGPLEFTEIPGLRVPARVVTVQGQKHLAGFAVESTPRILAALERYFGTPYPYEKLDLIAVPEYWFGAMENPGAITFSDVILLLDPATASVSQRKRHYNVNAHELAHMWFGDLVTMAWWDDMWLNESFADWMGDKVTDQLLPGLGHQLGELQSIQSIMAADARPSTDPIRKEIERGDEAMRAVGLAYNKGKAVLSMFEHWIGPEAFRRGIQAYLKENAWKNAEAADLWRALGKVSGKDVTLAMGGYIENPGFPMIAVEPLADGSVRLVQKRFLNHGVQADPVLWQIPVALQYSDGSAVRTRSLLLTAASHTVQLGVRPVWILPNDEGRGYYRWSVPREMLLALAREGEKAMSPSERISFLGNLGSLLDAGELSADSYLEVLSAMAGDSEPVVALSVLAGLGKAQRSFVTDPMRDAFAAYLRRTLAPMAQRYGLESRAGEAEAIALLRPQLLAWLGRHGRDPEALALADRLAAKALESPGSVDGAIASVALQLHALRGDAALFERLRDEFESAGTPALRQRYLGALGQFEDAALAEKALRYVLEGPLRPNEVLSIPRDVASHSEARADQVFQWFLENYAFFKAKLPPAFLPGLVNAAAGCREARVATAKTFFLAAERNVPGTEKELSQLAEQVRDCAGLRARESAAVAAYLEHSGGSGASRAEDKSP